MNIIKTLNKKLFSQNHALFQETYQISNRDNIEIVDNNIVIATRNIYKYTQQITENCILDFVNKVNSRKKVNAKIIVEKDCNISKINCSIYDEQFKNKNLYFCVDKEESPLFFMIGNCFFVHNKTVNKNAMKNFAILNKQFLNGLFEIHFINFDIIYE